MYNSDEINALAKQIYEQNKEVGWWDDPNRCLQTVCLLCVSEVAEAMEGHRKDLMDDKLKHRKMEEVELADTFIRVLDLGAHLKLKYHLVRQSSHSDKTLPYRYMRLVFLLSLWAEKLLSVQPMVYTYSCCVALILSIAQDEGYDFRGAVEEKMAFNKTRKDHTREHRATKHGKRF